MAVQRAAFIVAVRRFRAAIQKRPTPFGHYLFNCTYTYIRRRRASTAALECRVIIREHAIMIIARSSYISIMCLATALGNCCCSFIIRANTICVVNERVKRRKKAPHERTQGAKNKRRNKGEALLSYECNS
jgi:hypothetical protein